MRKAVIFLLVIAAGLVAGNKSWASVCAEVQIEVRQEVSLERQAFDAHMRINNGLTASTLEQVKVEVTFADENGLPVVATSDPNNNSPDVKFFIRIDTMSGIDNVAGLGSVAPATSADINWLIIPAPGSAAANPAGTLYYVGAILTYTLGGKENVIEVTPDYIFVKPMPKLTLDYFLPAQVLGDDPMSVDVVEPIIPFSLGVRARNDGYGTAWNMKIDSAQPKIIENVQGLLVDFQIIGSEVNGEAATSSLLVGLGNIRPDTSSVARWQMTASLTGEFTEFSAYFSHADDLGGETTSLIEAINTHFLVRDVLVDGSGNDLVRDFLAKDNRNEDVYRVYGSDTVDNDVLYFTEGSSEVSMRALAAAQYELTTPALPSAVYVKLANPMASDWLLKEVVRSDGKIIKPENVWISQDRATPESPWDYYLNLFDVDSSGSYTIIYGLADDLPQPPELQLVAAQLVEEGQLLTFTIAGSDPNGTVPALTATSLPVGARFVDNGDGNGVFSWPTSSGQAGTYQVAFTADDGDLTDSGKVTIRVYRPGDTDMDGMDDAWELANFGSLDRDGTGDFDGDGISDLAEFLAGTDPAEVLNEAPSVPEISDPLTEAVSLTPELVVVNSVDPDDDLLTYNFQLFSGPGFNETTELVSSGFAVAEQAIATVWTVDVSLDDNTMYWWRVQANDGQALSEWASSSFFVNTVNDPPSIPQVSGPADLSEVANLTPTLEVTNSSDIDNDTVTYSFRLFAEDGETPVASSGNLGGGDSGVTGWTVTPALTDNTEYVWQVIATDEHGLAVESIEAAFFVNLFNEGPTAPTINAPAAGSEVLVYDLTLLVDNSTDPDRDNLSYYFEIDTVNTFDSVGLQVSSPVAEDLGQTGWSVNGLVENSRYYWRARSSDGLVDSDWAGGNFFVNAINEAPPIPSLVNPAAGAWLSDLTPLLQLGVVSDPDQDALTYEFEVYSDIALTALVASTTTTENSWPVAIELEDNLWYYWRARAVDEHGEPSDWMTAARFFTDSNGYDDTPVITLSAPAVDQAVNGDSVTVLWSDSDPDSSALIDLYHDNDNQGEDGLLIAGGISEDTDGVADGLAWDISALAEGTYYVYALIDDGNSSSTSYAPGAVVIDRTAPVSDAQVGIPQIVDGDTIYITGQTSLTLSATDSGSAPSGIDTISYSFDGAAQWLVYGAPFNLAGLADGLHDVAYSTTDLATNREADKNLTVVIDNSAPETTITVGSAKVVGADTTLFIGESAEFTLSANDTFSGVATTEYRLDNGTWLVYAPFTLAGLADGVHTIGYRSTDQLGNFEDERTLTVVVDNTAPVTTISVGSPQMVGADGTLYVGGITEFSLSAVDDFSGIALTETRIDNGIWTVYVPFSLAGMAEGTHTIGYRSTDQLGNVEDEWTLSVVVDNTAPGTAITNGSPQTAGSDGTLYVGGATEFGLSASDALSGVASSEYRFDNGSWLVYVPFTLAGLSDGGHIIGYRSRDNLGNVEVEQTLVVVVDNTAPESTITTGDPQHTGQDNTLYISGATGFTLSAADNSSGVASTEYRIDSSSWLVYATFTLVGLVDGTHTIGYRSTDQLGNVEAEQTLTVVVDNTTPVTAIITGSPQAVAANGVLYVGGATEVTLIATDSLSGVAITEYRLDNGSWLAYAPFTLAGLADGTHTIGYRSTDNLGNGEDEQTLTVVVDNTPPESAITTGDPKHTGMDATLYVSGATGFVLSATDTSSGVAITEYRLDNGSWLAYAPFTLAGLKDGSHTIGYRSTDQLGNVETERTLTVAVDNLAPVTEISVGSPQAVGASGVLYIGGATQFTLSATDTSSGVATTEYRFDNGSWLAYAPFTLAGLADGTHTVGYRSADNLGNMETEQTLTVVVDNTEPETTITTGDPKYIGTEGTLYVAGGTEFSLSATDGFSGVALTEYRIDSGSWAVYATFRLTDLADGTHTIGYRSTDQLGNGEEEQTLIVAVDNTVPLTRINFNNKNYQESGVTYLSRASEVVISAFDALSGVNASYYRFDDEISWQTYDSPFRLENLGFGEHVIHFYSDDNLGNGESINSVAFTMIGIEVRTWILNLPRVLVWTEDPDGLHGKNQPAYDRDDLLALFEEALGVPDIYFGVVTDKDEFKSELRSGIYNMAMVINQDTPFDAGFLREMREAVNRGMGLLVSSWGNNVHPIWQDLFGIDFSGSLPMNEDKRELFFYESPISPEQTLVATGRMLKIGLGEGELAGVEVEEGLPAVVLGEYGQGRTAFFAYNIIESALSGELSENASLLRNAASYLLPQGASPNAGGIALFETRIKLEGTEMDILAAESFSEGLRYQPLFDLVDERLEYKYLFEDGGEAVYRYFVNISDRAGEYYKETEISLGLNGSYVPYDIYTQAFMVGPDSVGLLVQAINLLDEYGDQYPDAVDDLVNIASQLAGIGGMVRTSLKECEQVIKQFVQSIHQVEKLPFDTTDLRGLLDEYLRIVEGEASLWFTEIKVE